MSAILHSPSSLKQSLRYHPSGDSRLMGRATYAASRIFIMRDDSGKGRLNTSYFLGALTSVAVSTAYRPHWACSSSATFNNFGSTIGPRQGRNFLKWRIHPIADKLGIPKKLVTFQVMRRTLGTDMQDHGTMKDAQQILRHASIKTRAEIYMQEIQASVRSAINSRTQAIFSQRKSGDLSQLENPVFHHRRPNSFKPRNATVPNGSNFVCRVPANY
jgi:hypothetical protein